eukprot:5126265-Prymnesium_polylepis.2
MDARQATQLAKVSTSLRVRQTNRGRWHTTGNPILGPYASKKRAEAAAFDWHCGSMALLRRADVCHPTRRCARAGRRKRIATSFVDSS